MKVAAVVSHMTEATLNISVRCLELSYDVDFEVVRIVAGKSPMSRSFNAALDIAADHGCDILVHTASDVLVTPDAVSALLNLMKGSQHYLCVASGYDAIHGISSGGLWAWNMEVMADRFRFVDVFKQDLDLCSRVEAATGKSRGYLPQRAWTYHHPIWTAEELYAKFRYSYPKYPKVETRARMEEFLVAGLERNPTNGALRAGLVGLHEAQQFGPANGSKDAQALSDNFHRSCASLGLQGKEFYVKHKQFEGVAQVLLETSQTCAADPIAPPAPLISW